MINDWKDFIYVIYIVFFGVYALDTPLEFLCSAPMLLLGYIGVFSTDRKTLYLLPGKREKDIEDFLEVVTELNEFEEVKVLEIRMKEDVCEKK